MLNVLDTQKHYILCILQARIDGIHVVVVVPEGDSNSLTFQGIASRPVDYNIFAVPSFAQLENVKDAVVSAMCNGKARFFEISSYLYSILSLVAVNNHDFIELFVVIEYT